MKKVENDSQPLISYIIPIFVLPILASFVGLVFYGILSSFDGVNFLYQEKNVILKMRI